MRKIHSFLIDIVLAALVFGVLFTAFSVVARAEGARVKPWQGRVEYVYRCPAPTNESDVIMFVSRLERLPWSRARARLREATRSEPELADQWRYSACWHFLDNPR